MQTSSAYIYLATMELFVWSIIFIRVMLTSTRGPLSHIKMFISTPITSIWHTKFCCQHKWSRNVTIRCITYFLVLVFNLLFQTGKYIANVKYKGKQVNCEKVVHYDGSFSACKCASDLIRTHAVRKLNQSTQRINIFDIPVIS